MQRVSEPKGSAQSGQNFRKKSGQNLRNPQIVNPQSNPQSSIQSAILNPIVNRQSAVQSSICSLQSSVVVSGKRMIVSARVHGTGMRGVHGNHAEVMQDTPAAEPYHFGHD
jgi:hypothetical protein